MPPSTLHPDALKPGSGQLSQTTPRLAPRYFWPAVRVLVVMWLALLAVEVFLRIRYPWDLLNWPESPFLTDLMKINLHRAIYSSPDDVNSFVYSPGLVYLTFAILKPFGLMFDIRFCRLVNVFIGMLAALFGALAVKRLVRSETPSALPRALWFVTWGLVLFAVSTNVLFDVTHPDNLQALMAMSVFCLCFTAIETKKFGWALATMCVSGIGVFAKQTGAICFIGPSIAFAVFNVWGWRRWCMLVIVGLIGLAFSLWLIWLPPSGRFFTLELLARQPLEYHRGLTDIFGWLIFGKRRLPLLCVCFLAAVLLWKAKGPSRRYLICWLCIGIFAAGPNAMAIIKIFGAANNLCLYEVWLLLLAWPAVVLAPVLFPKVFVAQQDNADGRKLRLPRLVLYGGIGIYVLGLVPQKPVPSRDEWDFGRQVQASVRKDVEAGRKVLVSHGSSFLINCGITEPPLDRCNSALEIVAGRKPELLSAMKTRFTDRQYERIYLTAAQWYSATDSFSAVWSTNVLDEILTNYEVETVFTKKLYPKILNRQLLFGATMFEVHDYKVLKPKPVQ